MELPIKNFDIDTNSKHLKDLCAVHDSEFFLGDIANLLTYIDTQTQAKTWRGWMLGRNLFSEP